MGSIQIAAAVTTAMALMVFVPWIRGWSNPEQRRFLLLLGCIGLFMSPFAYLCFRLPFIRMFEQSAFFSDIAEKNASLSDAIRLTYAPVTEEVAKFLPLMLLTLLGKRRLPSHSALAALALTVGVSFAIGEFWLVAELIDAKQKPEWSRLPWYAFGGYMGERMMTCFGHTLFAIPTLVGARKGMVYGALGLLGGMSLHYLFNGPIMLMKHRAFGFSEPTWGILLQVWLIFSVVLAIFALIALQFGSEMLARVCNHQMVCPECGETYRQPIVVGMNFGLWRYEPCGACHKWHWVTFKNLAPLPTKSSQPTDPGARSQ